MEAIVPLNNAPHHAWRIANDCLRARSGNRSKINLGMITVLVIVRARMHINDNQRLDRPCP